MEHINEILILATLAALWGGWLRVIFPIGNGLPIAPFANQHVFYDEQDGYYEGELLSWEPHRGYEIKGVWWNRKREAQYTRFFISEHGFRRRIFRKPHWRLKQMVKHINEQLSIH